MDKRSFLDLNFVKQNINLKILVYLKQNEFNILVIVNVIQDKKFGIKIVTIYKICNFEYFNILVVLGFHGRLDVSNNRS